MSRIHNNHSPLGNLSPIGDALETAAKPVRLLLQAIVTWRPLRRLDEMIRIARTRRELLELDDRMLRDIGVSRLDIEQESRRRFWDIDTE